MTLSVPSFLAAAISLLIPPPAEADVTFDQSVPPLEPGELPEHPAASSARAPSPVSVIRYDDLTRMPPVNFPSPSRSSRWPWQRTMRRPDAPPLLTPFGPKA